ncbi:cell surface protein [Neisseriaceae bacterium ESL0693]|nr:cell surface protein [Neisseriaceae bacterium ESL0693]
MVLDHVVFHTEEDYPADLSVASAATHMGYYWSWIVRRDLHNSQWNEVAPDDIQAVQSGLMSGAEFILNHMGGGLEDTDFNPEGRRFSLYYYDDEEEGYGRFMEDYVQALNTTLLDSFYHVTVSAENQLLLDGVFDAALLQWRQSLKPSHEEK